MTAYNLPVNKNGRVYPPDVMRKMIEDAKPRIEAGRMFGQIESPTDGRSRLSQASHVVRGLRVNRKGEIVGALEFLDTPAGRTAMEMVKGGAPIAGTIRGQGTVTNGVVGDATLSSVDITMAVPEFHVPSAVDQLADIVAEDEDDA